MQLLQGDCLELMKDIPEKSVDMVLCDLPYGTTENEWDKVINTEKLFAEYGRIVKNGGVIALFAQPPFNALLMMANIKQFRYEWIWQKSSGTGFLNANKMPLKAHENILIFYDTLPKYHPQMTYGHKSYTANQSGISANYKNQHITKTVNTDGSRYPVDVLQFASVNCSAEPKLHPTQKPVPLLEYLIKTYTDEGETVLDNCMGSGSTGVAAVNTRWDFIGIELDSRYYQIAKERIEAHNAQTTLF